MPTLSFQGEQLPLEPGQTVLDALLGHGFDIPNSCRAGACQSCLMHATPGTVAPEAQAGLKDTLKAQGYFLACRCTPGQDLEVSLPSLTQTRTKASIREIGELAPGILRLRLEPHGGFAYRAGQYVTLWRDDHLGRSYSLASLPGTEPYLEFHIKLIPNGALSGWLRDAPVGAELAVQGPAGECFYLPEDPEQPLLLVGTGTGLAPLYGIVRDALAQGHRGEIHLFHGALTPAGLYLVDELQGLARRHANFHYHAGVLRLEGGEDLAGIEQRPVDRWALEAFPSLKGWRAYLCGAADFVHGLRKRIFLAGARMGEIHADAFLSPAPVTGAPAD